MSSGVGDIGAAPTGSGFGNMEIAAGRRAAAFHLDTGVARAEQFARLMLGQHAGNVIVDHDNLVDFAVPLFGEHADRRRATTDAHALLGLTVNDRRLTCFDNHAGSAIDGQFHGFSIAQVEQCLAGDAPFLLAAMSEVIDPAQRKHLRAIFPGRDVANRLALDAYGRAFGAKMPIGIDLQFDATVGVDALGDDSHHVYAIDLG